MAINMEVTSKFSSKDGNEIVKAHPEKEDYMVSNVRKTYGKI